jgi:hypothetical protein
MNIHQIAKLIGIIGGVAIFFYIRADLASPYLNPSKVTGLAVRGAFTGGFLIYLVSGLLLRFVVSPLMKKKR